MFTRPKVQLSLALLILAGFVGCGRNVEQCCEDDLPCVDMPVGLHDEQGQTFVFEKDLDAFVLEEGAGMGRTVALKDQELDFDWELLEKADPDKKVAVFYPYDGRAPRKDQVDNLAKVDQMAKEVYENGGKIVLQGHSCKWHGTAAYNLAISQDRPEAIKKHLVEDLGIPASHVKTFGIGNEQPIAFEYSKDGQAPNRRVEVYELRA